MTNQLLSLQKMRLSGRLLSAPLLEYLDVFSDQFGGEARIGKITQWHDKPWG